MRRSVLAQSQDAVMQMAPQRAWVQGMRNAMAQFMKGFDLTLNFSDLSELVKGVPAFDPAAQAPVPPVQPGAMARRARPPVRPRPTGLQQLKMGLDQAAEVPVAAMLEQVLQQLPPMIAATGQGALYEAFRNNIVGIGRVHLQAHDYIFKLGFKGTPHPPHPITLPYVRLIPALTTDRCVMRHRPGLRVPSAPARRRAAAVSHDSSRYRFLQYFFTSFLLRFSCLIGKERGHRGCITMRCTEADHNKEA